MGISVGQLNACVDVRVSVARSCKDWLFLCMDEDHNRKAFKDVKNQLLNSFQVA